MRMRQIARLLCFAIVLPLAQLGCRGNSDWVVPTPAAEQAGERIRITGVVQYSNLEGGLYVIRGSDGTTYEPTNLPETFRKDGIAIEAEARRRDDMASIHQVGPIVELERIRRR